MKWQQLALKYAIHNFRVCGGNYRSQCDACNAAVNKTALEAFKNIDYYRGYFF